jgi:hypothetical protein
MTPEQIKILFEEAIQEKAVYNKLEGITRNHIYNWLNNRGPKPTTGDMINVLYQLKKVNLVLSVERVINKEVSFFVDGKELKSMDIIK